MILLYIITFSNDDNYLIIQFIMDNSLKYKNENFYNIRTAYILLPIIKIKL